MVWRMQVATRLAVGSPPPVARLALAFALGTAIGFALARPPDFLLLAGALPGPLEVTGFGRAAALVAEVLLLAALGVALYAFLAWVRAAADAWLHPLLGSPRPWRLAAAIVTIGAMAVGSIVATLAVGFLPLQVVLAMLATAEAVAHALAFFGLGLAGAILLNPLMLLAFVLSIVLPLAAARVERAGPPQVAPAWVAAGGGAAAVATPPRAPLRPGLALALGLCAGVASLVAMPVAWRMGLLDWWIESVGGHSLVGYVASAVLWQALVAATVSVAMRRHPILHGLLAGLVTGILAAFALALAPWPFIGEARLDLERILRMLAYVLYPGMLLAWAAAAAGAAIARRRHGTPG